MTNADVFEIIDKFAPFCTQMNFDNAGFLVGDKEEKLNCGIVALDITDGAIEFAKAKNANLIVTHHPVIFDPLKRVTADTLVFKLIKNGISVISAHTNLDMANGGINDYLCQIVGLESIKTAVPTGDTFEARTGELPVQLTADEFAEVLKEALCGAAIKYADGGKPIKTVGVCSGSGGSLLAEMKKLQVDAFVTADVKHNVFLEAAHYGIAIYDCGHFDTEDIIVPKLCKLLKTETAERFYEYHSDIIKSL